MTYFLNYVNFMPYNLTSLNKMEKKPIWISEKQNIESFEE